MNYLYILTIIDHSLKKLKHHIICVQLHFLYQEHVYAEDRLVYKLIEMENKLAASYESILIKLDYLTFSQLCFSKYVTNIMLESYMYIYNCYLNVCRTCGRP